MRISQAQAVCRLPAQACSLITRLPGNQAAQFSLELLSELLLLLLLERVCVRGFMPVLVLVLAAGASGAPGCPTGVCPTGT